MNYSKSLENEIHRILKCINSSEKIEHLEGCERMVNNFCYMNRDNDKIPYVKHSLKGALALREMQLN